MIEVDSGDVESKGTKLFERLNNCGVKFSIVFGLDHIKLGFGDEVCYILNDLTTEVLIKRNYTFFKPEYGEIEDKP